MEKFKTLLCVFAQLFIGLSLSILPFTDTYAKAGCCSGKGGVVGCSAAGHQMCKDGSTSASCQCTAPAAAATHKVTGCCSGHGGVASCNKETGFQMCKDKTQSSSCKCS